MLVVRYYNYDAKDNTYYPDYLYCNSVEACADGNVRLLALNIEPTQPNNTFIIKANQLINIKVHEPISINLKKDGE